MRTLRIWSTLVHVVIVAFAWAGLGSSAAAGIAGVLLLSVGLTSLADRALLAELSGPTAGDLMLRTGERLNRATLSRAQRFGQLEAYLSLVLVAITVVAAAAVQQSVFYGVLVGICGLLPLLLNSTVLLSRSLSRRISAAHSALYDRDYPRAAQLAEAMVANRSVPTSLRDVALAYQAEARMRMGQHDAAAEIYERRWTGAMDETAVPVARLRLGTGDTELARKVLEDMDPDNRVEQYALDGLEAHLAILEGQPDEVERIADQAEGEYPPFMADEMHLLRALARQAAGDTAGAKQALARLSREPQADVWMPATYPRLWQLLDDLVSGRRSEAVAPARRRDLPVQTNGSGADAFAPPAEDRPTAAARGRRMHIGAVPVEWLPIAVQRRGGAVVRGIAAALLLPLGGLLIFLTSVLALAGDDPSSRAILLVAPPIALVAVVVGTVTGVFVLRELLGWDEADRPVVRLENGKALSSRGLTWASRRMLAVNMMVALIFALLPALVEMSIRGSFWSLSLGMVAGALLTWGGRVRWRSQRAVWLLHFGEPGPAVRYATDLVGAHPHSRSLRVIQGMAELLDGQPDAALASWRESAKEEPGVWELAAWLEVGRRNVDADRVLRRTASGELGVDFRTAVLQGLVALRTGREADVEHRRSDWLELAGQLDNRMGAVLDLILGALDIRSGREARGRAHLMSRFIDVQDFTWVKAAWPFLWEALTDSGPGSPG